ncbi:TPA: hypothetical protein DEP94_03285 [Candidatus Nomurabacteria bacterium]|nr:hypothetical protein [Candidatus Nomurabacteria bacterium]
MNTEKAKRVLRSIRKIPHKHFVLHGSLTRSNTVLLRRPNVRFKKRKELHQKGIYATSLTEIAIMYATLENSIVWKYMLKKKEICILHKITNDTEKSTLNVYNGYIHVCRRHTFNQGGPLISFSKRPARVVRTFKISHEVLLYLWDKKDIKFVPEFGKTRDKPTAT